MRPPDARVRRVQRAVEWIEARLFEDMLLSDIAVATGGALSELHRVFTSVYGVSLRAYIRGRRLTEAARMLRDTSMPILEIAVRCRYGSQAAFTRAFRRHFEVPPGAFRAGRQVPWREIDCPRRSELEHRRTLDGDPRMHWVHQAVTLCGIRGVLDPLDEAAYLAAAQELADHVPAGAEGFGLASPEPPADGGLSFFVGVSTEVGCTHPETVAGALSPGLYAVFEHRGPVDAVRHTLAFVAQRWAACGFTVRSDVPAAERYRLPVPMHGDLEMELWLPVGAGD